MMDRTMLHTATGGALPLDPDTAMARGPASAAGAGPESAMPAVVREIEGHEVTLRGAELAGADGIIVTLPASASLCYGARGELAASHRHAVDNQDIAAARAHVAHLVREGKIYFAQPGETVSPAALAAAGQPFYVEIDKAGCKRLRRSYVA
jgi:hypothetical protein